jgi:plasmid stabilization system protein ParE
MPYEIIQLAEFNNDAADTLRYFSEELKVPATGRHLLERAGQAVDKLRTSPRLGKPYCPADGTESPYRYLIIRNHLVFYYINEAEGKIYLARFVYGRRNLDEIMKEDTQWNAH